MANYKKLHDEWKKAKKDAKLFHDGLSRLTMQIIPGLIDVKHELRPFPKFNMGLGPSLDAIDKTETKKKPVDPKEVKNAKKAVKQYEKDIKVVLDDADDYVKEETKRRQEASKKGEVKEKPKVDPLLVAVTLVSHLKTLDSVREAISKALNKDFPDIKVV